VQVIVEFEVPFERGLLKQRAVDAFFTYVSIDPRGKAQPVPPLQVGRRNSRSTLSNSFSGCVLLKNCHVAMGKIIYFLSGPHLPPNLGVDLK